MEYYIVTYTNRSPPEECALALAGLERCAALAARLAPHTLSLDTLLLTLCKFTGLLTQNYTSYIAIGMFFRTISFI